MIGNKGDPVDMPSFMFRTTSSVLVAIACCLACSMRPGDDGGRAPGLAAEFQHLAAAREYWPGFEPMSIPLAVYDGSKTWLFRHPSPPDGFVEVPGSSPAATVFEGRHSAMVANTSAPIGGVDTATVMLDGLEPDRDFTDLAALTLHEAFHVFQRSAHPAWGGNEADAFVYPVEDADLLALRRMETEALRRAFDTGHRDLWKCWAIRALENRATRFERMDPGFAAYERGTELNEGLATYVQFTALNRTDVEIPAGGFPAGEVRGRAYETGVALALLLDRFDPEWPARVDASDEQFLDATLAENLDGNGPGACGFSEEEIARIRDTAHRDVEALLAARIELRDAFEARPGWRLVIEADPDDPLWPRGFDPSNLNRVEGGVLHTRFLKLGNDSGEMEVLDGEALTEGAGTHPLFNGVRRVVITGLTDEPETIETGDRLAIHAPSLTVDFSGYHIDRSDGTISVRLGRL
jgi:hypothetical protein